MRFSLPLLGLATQVPLQSPLRSATQQPMQQPPALNDVYNFNSPPDFAFKEAADIMSPKDMIELQRPGQGVANLAGELVLVPTSKYSFSEKKNKKSVVISPLESVVEPLEIPLPDGGEVFWLDPRTIAHAVPVESEKKINIYAIPLEFKHKADDFAGVLRTESAPILLGSIPTTSASNFRYTLVPGILVFSDYVYANGNLSDSRRLDEAWENRGTSALVYDATFERHWDTWVTPKKLSLFSVRLFKDPDHKWNFDGTFINLLKGTSHSSPVEPFGGTDDFDISHSHLVYTTKDPELPEAWHTKQNVYVVDLQNQHQRKELTSGQQGAIHSPVFNLEGNKVAWLELDKDGYESDRAKIVIYDLNKGVRFTVTQDWDRSPDKLAFSKEGNFLYFTAGDEAKVKVYVLPVPPTPGASTTHPKLDKKYTTPIPLTHSAAASGLQTLFTGRLIFTRSSFTSPNNVFIIRGLKRFETELEQSDSSLQFSGVVEQVTRFNENELQGKNLSEGEEFWFTGAEDKKVQGWVLKPKGFKAGEEKKWPAVLLIHGGPQGAWEDQWSTRWNPNVFAAQGYVTVMINPTGSTTFGQEFTDAIAEDWGGKPFVDMQAGWKYILEQVPEIDPERAVAAGASWGGYAINWIQGHPEYGFNFKALVCHDGVFDATYNGYSTDELFFFNHEWGGRPWDKKTKTLAELMSPSNFVHQWSTPQLIIHGSKDYRLPETEGIGAFHALLQREVPTRLVIFPDENHWVLNHLNSLKWHYEVFRWFDKFVGEKE
ncbi:hypothetical protein PC9H_010555 [Pleurotus ostreatus]|uniref:Dipeptidyl-peptidase V n=2 Tax=Pleurotus TaxID=5320 RepID=A0A8H7DNR1_PLEOS|nr:uncharacterized protein PC9H_010555 [Pleurotus ostreatus]KAF7422399.1 hypothetical protein PC9H_010555 [Pleurotus ostreatus]KAG9227716.1 hypothetical protein CCMSSC00406_0000638 [Pleurotus cornucopiae]KAJ8691768.1 Dipeptidyl-peptidase 5 [Pleurotus ostreatus]